MRPVGAILAIAVGLSTPAIAPSLPMNRDVTECEPIINPQARISRVNLEKLQRLRAGSASAVVKWLGAPYCLKDNKKGQGRAYYYPLAVDTSVWIVVLFNAANQFQGSSLVIGQSKP